MARAPTPLALLLALAGCGFRATAPSPDLGGCSSDCPPTVLATSIVGGAGLVVGATDVFWTEQGDSPDPSPVGGVFSTSKPSGCPEPDRHCVTTRARFRTLPTTLVMAAPSTLCWTEGMTQQISVVCLDVGASDPRALILPEDIAQDALIVDGVDLVWVERTLGAASMNGAIVAAPRSAPMTIVTPRTLVGALPSPYGLALTVDAVYWSESSSVWAARPDGTGARVLGTGLTAPWRLRPFGATLYFADADGVWLVPVDASAQPKRISGEPSTVLDVAVDTTGLYWLGGTSPDYGDGVLMRADLDGNNVKVLRDKLVYPALLALDDDRLYWLSDGTTASCLHDGQVLSIAKP
jgi:hypothetical protein